MYGTDRVLTCDECGVTGEDVDAVNHNGERRDLCPTHNRELLAGEGGIADA